MTTPQMPRGWYSAPDGSGGQRYWDGQAWTEHRAPAPSAPPPTPPTPPAPSPPPEPPSASEDAGIHRAPEDLPQPPAQPTEPVQFAATPPTPSPPPATGGGDRQLLVRYLTVCAALLAVLVAVAVYAAFIADDDSAKFTVSNDPATTTTADAGRGEPPTDTAAPTAMPTFPEIGVATDGALAFSVDSVEFTPTVSSADFPIEKTAAGEFVVVHMEVTNTSDEPVTFLGTFQKLMADGAVYSIDDVATFYTGGALVELDPGDHADIAVVFDVPPGTDPETIELRADPLGPGVELPLP
ncbi:MAG: DUF4352 domain-containing protein [Mycobacterium sp.]